LIVSHVHTIHGITVKIATKILEKVYNALSSDSNSSLRISRISNVKNILCTHTYYMRYDDDDDEHDVKNDEHDDDDGNCNTTI
jgi:hypothetical protein